MSPWAAAAEMLTVPSVDFSADVIGDLGSTSTCPPCVEKGAYEKQNIKISHPLPIPRGSLSRCVSITAAFCSSYIDKVQHKQARGSVCSRARGYKNLSPWINSLLIQDNGAWALAETRVDAASYLLIDRQYGSSGEGLVGPMRLWPSGEPQQGC